MFILGTSDWSFGFGSWISDPKTPNIAEFKGKAAGISETF
jgi:hypothetical protein